MRLIAVYYKGLIMFENIDDLISKDKKGFKETKTVGRPKKQYGKKDKRLVSYFTVKEMINLEKLAEDNDLTVSQMARQIILKYIKENVEEEE